MQERDGDPCRLEFEFSRGERAVFETAPSFGRDLNEQATQFPSLPSCCGNCDANAYPMTYVTVGFLHLQS